VPLRLLSIVLALGLTAPAAAAETLSLSFPRDVLPILAKNCFACHGPDESHREADLRLDVREAALAELPSGSKAVVPGKPEASELLSRITTDDADLRMPPSKHGKPLTGEQVATLRRWIAEGASYAKHWSFTPPVDEPPPAVKNRAWPKNDLDRFILARLEAEGLTPNDEADAATLCRRVHLDLTGLPPSPEVVQAFVASYPPSLSPSVSPSRAKDGGTERRRDGGKDPYEALVDKLLADAAYGERWARPWLDLARYADSRGYGSDPLRLNIWPYRDWVINALNRDLPYDQFTIEQLAGDLLAKPSTEQLVATAFHRNTMTNTEGGTDDEEFRVAAVNDRTHVTLQVWMGLTMGCAKCHTHKYDPISQKDYYRTFAIFNQTEDADRNDESPNLPLPGPDEPKREAERAKLRDQIAALKKTIDADTKAAEAATKDKKPLDDKIKKAADDRKAELKKLESALGAIKTPDVPVMRELPKDKRRPTHVLVKGNFLNKGEPVEPGLPSAFHAPAEQGPPDRMTLARWLVARDNPLTARVAVNRVWAQLFGIGLVETEEDFGVQGALPSHPELLDWLALRFMEGSRPSARPWSQKQLIKLIVMSQTYRQSSKPSAAAQARDPRNRLLSHAPRVRLDAETVRDQALAVSGLLSRKIGGPSVFPPQPAGMWQAAFNGERTWKTSEGADKYRRGLYTFWRRTVPYPSMATFDAPSREICSVRRIRTNTPLQALVTLNDPVYVEAAQALARRVLKEGGSSPDERIRFALLAATGRPAADEQVATIRGLLDSEHKHFQSDKAAAKLLATDPLGPLPAGVDEAEAAAWTVVANVLLNLDAVLMRG
jgi:mono/diheme cytochrome c family protein